MTQDNSFVAPRHPFKVRYGNFINGDILVVGILVVIGLLAICTPSIKNDTEVAAAFILI